MIDDPHSALSGSADAPLLPPRSFALRRQFLALAGIIVIIALAIALYASLSHPRTATITVDKATAPGQTSDTVRVAAQLGPAVGTIVLNSGGTDALGSGFVISNDGTKSYLLTNNHVVANGKDIHVVMPGGQNLLATVVGTDSFDDLAVVSVTDASLPAATFSSSSQLKVGQSVVAIGSPLGNQGSVTQGVISALHRTINAGSGTNSSNSETLQDVLQIDAPINPGNSGGPLADAAGRVVGVNVAVADANNIGFSIPSDIAQSIALDLIGGKPVQHPYLGITYLTNIEAVQSGQGFNGPGVLVRDVRSGSPAASAGFRTKDILVAVDGTLIDNGQTLGGLIQTLQVGSRIDFMVQRGSQTLHLQATLVNRPTNLAQQ